MDAVTPRSRGVAVDCGASVPGRAPESGGWQAEVRPVDRDVYGSNFRRVAALPTPVAGLCVFQAEVRSVSPGQFKGGLSFGREAHRMTRRAFVLDLKLTDATVSSSDCHGNDRLERAARASLKSDLLHS